MSPRLKVRTGCSVCKIRRVKCDETKPFCERCTSTGRKCEGYAAPPPRKTRTRRSKYDVTLVGPSAGTIVNSNTSNLGIIWSIPRSLNRIRTKVEGHESRSFDYYRSRVSANISNYFDKDFWNILVLQVSEGEPTIRHALLALSSLYEAGETSQAPQSPTANDGYNCLTRFAIYEHTKAISGLLNKMSMQGPPLEVILMSCLLFTWMEYVRYNPDGAVIHLQSGLRILNEHRQSAASPAIVEQLAYILGRELVQALLHRSSAVEFDYHALICYNPGPGPLYFETLTIARCDIDGKRNKIWHFLRTLERAGLTELHHVCCAVPAAACLKCEYEGHISGLKQWIEAFECLKLRLEITTLPEDALKALQRLELSYLLISNVLDTLFATTTMVFDRYNDAYARMVYLGRQLLHNQNLRRTSSLFPLPLDNNIQGALFNVVLRCRHLHIRQEVVELFRLCPDYDGIWGCKSLIAFSNWKINVEERGRPPGAPETEPLPESARVWGEKAREVVRDGQVLVAIRFKRGAPGGNTAVGFEEEVVPDVSMRLAPLLGTPLTMPLNSPAQPFF